MRWVVTKRTIRELTRKNLELEQNFNRRAYELEDTNAQLQARVFKLEGSKLSRRPDEEADSGLRRQDRSLRRSQKRLPRTSLRPDDIRMASERRR